MSVTIVYRDRKCVDAGVQAPGTGARPPGDDGAGGVAPGPGQHVLIVVHGARLKHGLVIVVELLVRARIDCGHPVRVGLDVQEDRAPRRNRIGRAVTIQV